MRKYFFVFMAAAAAFIFYSFTVINQPGNEVSHPDKSGLIIPDDVQQIIDKHCFGCHNTNSKNKKAKEKLKFDKLPGLRKSKQIGKLGKIAKMLKENKMPPKKFIEWKPEAALSEQQRTTLHNWAESAAKSLSH